MMILSAKYTSDTEPSLPLWSPRLLQSVSRTEDRLIERARVFADQMIAARNRAQLYTAEGALGHP